MTRPSFNVLTEPWIPVIRIDGTRDEMGIMPCLLQAHEIREIRDPSPIVEFGLYRLIVAFVLDALILADKRPEGPLDLRELIKLGRFEVAVLESYIAHCGEVFDLFHHERPFLQTSFSSKDAESIAKLNPVFPVAGAVHWHHFNQADIRRDVKAVARELTSIAPFSLQGGRGYGTSPGGASSYYVMPMGQTLHETLVLNLPIVGPSEARKLDTQGVAWRRTDDPVGRRSCATTLEGLTWRARRVHLRADGDNLSTEIDYSFAQIMSGEWRDPAVAYRYLDAKELERRLKKAAKDSRASSDVRSADPVQARLGRAAWRDFAPLALLSTKHVSDASRQGQTRRPDVVEVASQVADLRHILVVALITDKANCDHWLRSRMPTPANLANSEAYAFAIQAELQVAEDVANLLNQAVQRLQPRSDKKKPKDLQKMLGSARQQAESAFWISIEGQYWELVSFFANADPSLATIELQQFKSAWRKTLAGTASKSFDKVADGYSSDSDALERQVKARVRLHNSLRKHLI